ncbi:hypothetical protein UPYG_G00247300 [Umbra pygmaea]|uniref:CST complex subunit CTC1 n=1 Tax=Umbra pygmaea TaxID=75934 RepID=A0ABD0WGG5_UMBPY
MAAVSCPLQRTLSRSGSPQPGNTPLLCREPLWVLSVQRYERDHTFSLYFPQAITASNSLYDATLTDGDCRLRVTLDPRLNRLVERNVFRCGAQLQHVTFLPWLASEEQEEEPWSRTYRVVSVDVSEVGWEGLEAGVPAERLVWFGAPLGHSAEMAPSLLPLRARRCCYLALWNNQDPYGALWTGAEACNSTQTASDSEEHTQECVRPTVTLRELQEDYVSRVGVASVRRVRANRTRRVARGMLVVRVLNKSRLMYYGKSDSNCECPYKAVLEVCDASGCVCPCVFWNSLCLCWYMKLLPGQLLMIRGYRVKEMYDTRATEQQKIEISLNSRNPAAQISILSESSLSAEVRLPCPSYLFCSGKELLSCPPGNVCDVIGLVVFSGRPERIKSKVGQEAELLEYQWLRLEDGTSAQPVMIKLFSTSQPEIYKKIHPLSVVVVTRLLLVKASSSFYLTNTSYTQVYSTGSGHHSTMPYRKLHPVRQFVQWLQSLDDREVLSRSVVGGFFVYPLPPVSLEILMKNRTGELGLLTGVELKREVEQLQYRERRCFFIQATVIMVTYCRKGGEDQCLVWTDKHAASSPRPSLRPLAPPPRPSPSPGSSIKLSPRLLMLKTGLGLGNGASPKRRLFSTIGPPTKRLTLFSDPEVETDIDGSLWEASMEFLEADDEDDDEEQEDSQPLLTAPSSPGLLTNGVRLGLAHIAMETLPLQYCPVTWEEQAFALGMQTGEFQKLPQCPRSLEKYTPARSYTNTGHYTFTMRALSDGGMIDAVFLPGSAAPCTTSGPSLLSGPSHSNQWSSILTHGGFSPHTPPPAPADLIATASQLANQRLVCVLETCLLEGDRVEFVLSRAYPLRG